MQVGCKRRASEDILAHAGHFCEEEEGEDAGDGAEAAEEGAAGGSVLVCVLGGGQG